jgi:oligopeptide/dipeptide ABC transporter ATP-binding protein
MSAVVIDNLSLTFGKGAKQVYALDGVSLTVASGIVLGIVGESGSGKSTLGFALGRLMPDGVRPVSGSVQVFGQDIWTLGDSQLRALRNHTLRYVFQDPIATLNPTRRIGVQLAEAVNPPATEAQVFAALEEVGLPDPARVAQSWPHELSGGMAQRVAIAMAFIANPRLVVADEATSALDASVRTRILDLLRARARATGATLLLISHDLWAVRAYSDQVAVMYGGRIVEHGPSAEVFAKPLHPYTRALLAATPGHERQGESLATIPGAASTLHEPSPGCAFAPRCTFSLAGLCDVQRPVLDHPSIERNLLCHRWRETAGNG